MNPGILQCKNCWKWDHMVGVCHIQESKCVRCNGPHLTEHHCHFAWCCKANEKTNPPRLETKKGEPCPHTFKCLNCKDEHQADSYDCLFWKHYFNKEWHSKEYMKIQDNRKNLTCSVVNSFTIWFWKTQRYSLKMYKRTTFLSIPFLKSTKILTSYSSKNHCR